MTELDTGTTELLATVEEGVGVLTLNRPARRNALSRRLLESLARMLRQFETDDDVGCVVLTGAGGAFCAGGDLKGMADQHRGEGGPAPMSYDAGVHWQRINQRETAGRLWAMPKPTIAAMPGAAAGAGLSLALACDLRYAAAGAILTTAFARVGFAGDYGGTWFLTRLVGAAKARELYFLSERITAEEAEQLGMVNAVFAAEDLEREALDRARRLAAGPSVAYRYMKENLNRAVNGELGECLDIEVTHHTYTGTTEDHRAAVKAFVEHREPTFRQR
jgi:2-(1,2-epoxy-1,2-dihydrophenyl)acetyl-CoA isomerase